ncbi:DUF3899 domain-containing protein [Bacillus sp. JJ722]|uniref:DUF3899 domain-containing protein n=1 Tax=Bacillus sp. JJ722 TaxID=3122973 RepID=UPI002FFFA6C6
MIEKLKNNLLIIIIIATICFSILLSFIVYEQISLLHFINISFYFSSAYIGLGLLILIVDRGFFDGISYSFRKMFLKSHPQHADEEHELVPLSQLINVPYSQLLTSGLALLVIMLVGLFFYYQ